MIESLFHNIFINPVRTQLKSILLGAILFFATSTWAQICTLTWAQNGHCLDISKLNGDTILLPSNVTQLSQSGLTLCPLKSSRTTLPAIIFVVDESMSMDSAWDPSPAGDPAHWRAKLVRYAIQYMHSIAGSGWFSYIQFAWGVDSRLVTDGCNPSINGSAKQLISTNFLPLTDSIVKVWTDTNGPVQNRCSQGTDYYSALERAKYYATNFNPGDNLVNPVIIFISDGSPSVKTDSTFLPLRTNDLIPGMMPPIYGIFLGSDSTSSGDTLAQLSNSTGGTYSVVSPGDTLQMQNVMSKIIQHVSTVSKPSSVSLLVNGKTYNGVTTAQTGSQALVTFPQTMPLTTGKNAMELEVSYMDSSGLPRTESSLFTLAVQGSPLGMGLFPLDSIFASTCVEGDEITVNGLLNPSLTVGASLAQTPHLGSDTLKTLEKLFCNIDTASCEITKSARLHQFCVKRCK